MKRGVPARPMRERFELKYCPEPNSGCWLWTGALSDNGYGSIRGDGSVTINAHRASWLIHRGPIPDGLQVLHKCDVRSCVNPDHLFLGTQLDNVDDMHRKGRAAPLRGEESAVAKLTEVQVRQILQSPARPYRLAVEMGVSPETIRGIKKRRSWRHVEG